MDLVKLLARSKLLHSPSSTRDSVGIFWDLDNKPPDKVPPYDAAVRLKNLASQFGLPTTMAAYANRHTFTFLPDWVRAQRRQRKALDILESDGIIRSRDPYVCEVCGRKFETNIKFQKHFKQLHEREHHKRLARLESLKGKKKDFFKAKIGPKEEKYRAAAKEVLLPEQGYGLAGELKKAGFCVRTVRDKPQAADIALENDMMEAIEDEIQCLCLVSDDSDFVRVLKKARARNVRTVVVGDFYGDLKLTADANFSWRDVSGGHAWRDDSGLKRLERNYRPKSTKNFEGEEEDDLFESLGSENDDEDDFRLEECNDEVGHATATFSKTVSLLSLSRLANCIKEM
ncbi:hypothetical protein SUGI_1195200 [Cryptomeria japonica]|nr:hypothetical protein SUGI_1195200 [Cryptomeria japonica]